MSSFPLIDENNFEQEVLRSQIPVILEFGAEWCAPCKRLEPILEQLSGQWAGKVRVVKADVDESVNLAMQYQVMSVPTLFLFINGEPTERLVGLQSKDKLIEKFGSHL